MTRVAKQAALYTINLQTLQKSTFELFVVTEDDGGTWRVLIYRDRCLPPEVHHVTWTSGRRESYQETLNLFSATLSKAKRELLMRDDDAPLPLPVEWGTIDGEKYRFSLPKEAVLADVLNEPSWVAIAARDSAFGHLTVRSRLVTWNETPLDDNHPVTKAMRALGGDMLITAWLDRDGQTIHAVDLCKELCLPKRATYDQRLAALRDLVPNQSNIIVQDYVSDSTAKRAVAHDYQQGSIKELLFRTRCPMHELSRINPITEIHCSGE